MAIYTYRCECTDEALVLIGIPISERDEQNCRKCDSILLRQVDCPGSVWAPTAGGMR